MVVANTLRSEPDIWIARAEHLDQRADFVLDALGHLPRPAILYVTKPKTANEWYARLKEVGYGRIACVTGETTADERSQLLSNIRASSASDATVDLVVATAAFGLGIDTHMCARSFTLLQRP